jgi:hypothetical protein
MSRQAVGIIDVSIMKPPVDLVVRVRTPRSAQEPFRLRQHGDSVTGRAEELVEGGRISVHTVLERSQNGPPQPRRHDAAHASAEGSAIGRRREHYGVVRVMMIGGQSFGVSVEQEAEWPSLVSEAVRAVRDGERQVPTVWFRTNAGVVGSLPVSDRFPVAFVDDEKPLNFMGAVTLLGRVAEPPDAYNAR